MRDEKAESVADAVRRGASSNVEFDGSLDSRALDYTPRNLIRTLIEVTLSGLDEVDMR